MKKDADIQDYIDHFPPGISPEIEEYVTEEVLDFSRYIFTSRKGKRRFGYCTHCNSEFLIEKPIPKPKETTQPKLACIWCTPPIKKEPAKMQCPNCGSECIVKASGRSRKYLIDSARFVYYEKSLKNPEVVVARCFCAWRNYTGDYRNIKTDYRIEALYVFEMGCQSIMFTREVTFKKNPKTPSGYEAIYFWKQSSSIYSPIKDDWSAFCDGIEEAVKDTPFQYSTWESYDDDTESNMVKFFDLYSRYPMIEYLTKLGFENLVKDKLMGGHTYNTVNWNGKNLFKVLKLTKQEIHEIKAYNINVTFSFLNSLKEFKKHNIDLSLQELAEINIDGYSSAIYYREIFQLVLEYTSAQKGYKYFKKQIGKDRITSISSAMGTWKDYIADCKKLNINLTNDSVVFPRNLYQAHQNTTEQVQINADKALDNIIHNRAKKLAKQYSFEYNSLLIRPADSTKELICEGKELHHCVGTYAKGYAEGVNVILVIRKKSAPYKPYFTVEVRHNTIIQCRGLRNCAPDAKVEKFMEAFKAEKLQKTKSKKTKITVPA